MLFRRLITPWYLCRDLNATWSGQFIIPRCYKRPVPEIVVLNDSELESKLTQTFRRTQLGINRDGAVDLQEVKLRTDELKKMAWSRLYESVQGLSNYQAQQKMKAD